MKLILNALFINLLFIGKIFSSESCLSAFQQITQSNRPLSESILLHPAIRPLRGVTYHIPRVGVPKRTNERFKGRIPGLFEVEISKLSSIHPIPNPDRRESPRSLENLLETLPEEGFQLSSAIQVALLKNGELKILGGHHRMTAMKMLGETHVPAEIYVWSKLDPDVRQMYKEAFIDMYVHRYPEFYRSLKEDPSLFD